MSVAQLCSSACVGSNRRRRWRWWWWWWCGGAEGDLARGWVVSKVPDDIGVRPCFFVFFLHLIYIYTASWEREKLCCYARRSRFTRTVFWREVHGGGRGPVSVAPRAVNVFVCVSAVYFGKLPRGRVFLQRNEGMCAPLEIGCQRWK